MGCELVPALSPSDSHSTNGVSGSAPHSKGQGAGDGGQAGQGAGCQGQVSPGRWHRTKAETEGPRGPCGQPWAGGGQPLNPRIEVPVAAGPPFVRNSIRWQSRY